MKKFCQNKKSGVKREGYACKEISTTGQASGF